MIELTTHDFVIRGDSVYDIDGRVVGYITGTSREVKYQYVYAMGTQMPIPGSSQTTMKIELYFDSFLNHKRVASKETIENASKASAPVSERRAIKI